MAGIDMGAFQREVDRNFAQRQQQVSNATKLVALEAARNPAQIAQAQSSANLNNVTASELPLNGAMDRRAQQADLDPIGLAGIRSMFGDLGMDRINRFLSTFMRPAGAAPTAAPAAPAAGAPQPNIQGRPGNVKAAPPSLTQPLVPPVNALQPTAYTQPQASANSITQAAAGLTDTRPRRSPFTFGTMV